MSNELPRKRLLGYADRMSVAPGERIAFKLSVEGAERYRATVVRLVAGDRHPQGRGLVEVPVATAVDGEYPARVQPVQAGSYGVVENPGPLTALESFTLQAWIWPTAPGRGEQVLMGAWSHAEARGFALLLDQAGAVALRLGGEGRAALITTGLSLLEREWALVGCAYDGSSGRVSLWQTPRRRYPIVDAQARTSAATEVRPQAEGLDFLIAACAASGARETRATAAHYNGKLEAPRVLGRAIEAEEAESLALDPPASGVVAAWDFSRDIPTTRFRDRSPQRLDGRFVNLPARAMKGVRWTGEVFDWTRAPEQYGAVHFHDDDLYDCGWRTDFELEVPEHLTSGIYAARIEAAGEVEHVPFIVRPPRGRAHAQAVALMPTASYLAYANEHLGLEGGGALQASSNHLPAFSAGDLLLGERPELGYSLYDRHADGSGVCYSSRLRPILNFRPGATSAWVGAAGTVPWQFNADLALIDWLEHEGFGYDVVTDEDLHEEGLALLGRYRVLLTGSHPEYWSRPMYEALEGYLEGGGRLMYLGGNGFYWRIAFHRELPGVIELRRAEDGIRDWTAEGGEYYHSFTGEYGGMWSRMGRPIHALVGVGMAGQGFDVCTYYRRTAASRDPRAAFIFEGVEDEIVGDFGTVGGGAAGIEVDRCDRALGSPPHALVVASSEDLSDVYYPGPEEIDNGSPLLDASQNPDVRADMTFFETPAGGAVFSTGSIAWIGSLSWQGFRNNVARITGNVLRRFLKPECFVTRN